MTAASAQSRADVLVIVLSAVLVLAGLQWLAIKPWVREPVEPQGMQVAYFARELPRPARQELQW